MRATKQPQHDPKAVMASMLHQLKEAEGQIREVLESFNKLPKGSKNAKRRRGKLLAASELLAVMGFHLCRDWEKSSWFDEQEHLDFLHAIENELKLASHAQKE